jgi:hypothetical protein
LIRAFNKILGHYLAQWSVGVENGPAVKRENLLAMKKMNLVQIQIKQTDLSLHAVLTTAVNTYHMMIVHYPKKQLPTITNKQASKLRKLAQCGNVSKFSMLLLLKLYCHLPKPWSLTRMGLSQKIEQRHMGESASIVPNTFGILAFHVVTNKKISGFAAITT